MRLIGPALAIILLLVVPLFTGPDAVRALDCSNFTTQKAAQDHLRLYPSDPDRLDGDNNGVACDNAGLSCPCDISPVLRTISSTQTTTGSSGGTPIPTISGGTTSPTATVIGTVPAPGTGMFVGTPSGTSLTCPRSGEWLGLYWNGGTTAVATAARSCSTADRIWARRGLQWRGYATEATAVSDQFNVEIGEFVFVHGR